ncbi:FecCD family ABC transporter permease [Actinomadura algeriensis]|uniref:Iron complex transport system permease protein n=1 Tax=Actinomadura algeriensis TaxID=1679523 RepID=A0ABR9JQ90_9ACTN|nr:iron chelate uptake ABC transporter family permease subunit [Actinomadura algeriensis]MBE1532648.1 iron complex transport system permease protein [Actinomadura algeriensis]
MDAANASSLADATVPARPRTSPPPARKIARGPARLGAGLVLTAAAVLAAAWASLLIGPGDVPAGAAWNAIFDYDPAVKAQLIAQEVRIPRTVAGLLAGAALGLAGAIMQGVARNPLADPGLLGVNAGAAVAVVVAIGLFGLTSPAQYIWFGFLGALGAAVLVYTVAARGRGGATPVKLALAGAATAALLGSITRAILLTQRETYEQFRFWEVGSLAGRDGEVLRQALPFIVAGVVLALCLGPRLNALSLGDDVARGLGQRVGLARAGAAAVVVLLCGSATVVAGPLIFVGLVVPHVARLIVGPDHRWLLPYSALLAPVLLLVSDIIGRVVAWPGEVQVGIVTGALGSIPFIWLVRRRETAEL